MHLVGEVVPPEVLIDATTRGRRPRSSPRPATCSMRTKAKALRRAGYAPGTPTLDL